MEFEQILDKYKSVVDKELNKFFDKKINEAKEDFLKTSYSYLKEFVLRPGKRIRPVATIMAYKSIKDSNERYIYPVSIAPELFHASSLVHDDIMDEDMLRRNKPTAHVIFKNYFEKKFRLRKNYGNLFDANSKRFSVSLAIIQGNLLYSLATSSILDSRLDEKIKNKSLKICNNAYLRTNEGQTFDILMSYKNYSNEKEYINMALNKTASPISASIKFGAIANNATSIQLNCLEKYGMNVGLAFQIHDDIMDISKNMNKGRKIASDLKRGNKTMVIIKALKKGNKIQKDYISNVLGNEKASNADIEKAVKCIEETGAITISTDYAKAKILEAKKYLKKSRLNKGCHDFFMDFADYLIKRRE